MKCGGGIKNKKIKINVGGRVGENRKMRSTSKTCNYINARKWISRRTVAVVQYLAQRFNTRIF